ncbi:MAG TPA: hypothetical protein C5S51_06880 [Methanosarcinaceae archaeon]|nr:hypothetical protein [Methanosarcinaceae archaeon]
MEENVMKGKVGKYSLIASVVSSVTLSAIFVLLAVLKNSGMVEPLYTQVDIAAGAVFVFILSMIVSASIWPNIVEKRLKRHFDST